MKKSKEYKISVALFIASVVFGCISLVTGLMPDRVYSINKICMYLCFASLGFGLVYRNKAGK